jgi:enamine deaminase RidA (YjgF/YER057c/UK114 family)
MTPTEKLRELNLTLPPVPQRGGSYVPVKTVGNLVFCSGVTSQRNGEMITGKVGKDAKGACARSTSDAVAAARECALLLMANLDAHLGSLDKVTGIASLTGYVQCTADFHEQPTVINGASDLLEQVFGESGKHARAALGCIALPRNALVEITLIATI